MAENWRLNYLYFLKGKVHTMFFFVILGLLCFIMGVFSLGFSIRILKKGKCVIGKICEIEEAYRSPAICFCIEVQFNKDGQEIKRIALEAFVPLPFF